MKTHCSYFTQHLTFLYHISFRVIIYPDPILHLLRLYVYPFFHFLGTQCLVPEHSLGVWEFWLSIPKTAQLEVLFMSFVDGELPYSGCGLAICEGFWNVNMAKLLGFPEWGRAREGVCLFSLSTLSFNTLEYSIVSFSWVCVPKPRTCLSHCLQTVNRVLSVRWDWGSHQFSCVWKEPWWSFLYSAFY